MIATARIRADSGPRSFDWIPAYRSSGIRKLLKAAPETGEAPLDPESLVPDAIAEIQSPDCPGERLLVCLNPRLREERARKREALLRAAEQALEEIDRAAGRRGPKLRGRESIARRVGRDAGKRKVAKRFDITVSESGISWSRREGSIAREARPGGIYVVRTSLKTDEIAGEDAVTAYKSLPQAARAFRPSKTSRLKIRPVFVYTEEHVRGHVFMVMLAWHVERHMRRRLAPMLFEDGDPEGAAARRDTPVRKAEVSDAALAKAGSKKTADGRPVHSMPTLLADLATFTLNEAALRENPDQTFALTSTPAALHEKAFRLLGVDPARSVAM